MKKDIEGFFSSPFFAAIKPQNFVYSKELIKPNTFNDGNCFTNSFLYMLNLNLTIITRDEVINIVRESILDILALEDLIGYFVTNEEDNIKALNLIKRKQYNSKLLNLVLDNFSKWSDYIDAEKLKLVLLTSISQKISQLKEKKVLEHCANFKLIMDKVTGGLAIDCYISFINRRGAVYVLEKALLDYTKNKYGYDLNDNTSPMFYPNNVNEVILSLIVYNDPKFWNFDNNNVYLLYFFLNLVLRYNGLTYAEKIIDYAFKEICKTERGKYIYENKFPIYFLESSLENKILSTAIEKIRRRLGQTINFTVSEEETKGLLYPYHGGFEEEIVTGKEIFKKFISKAYPKDRNFVLNLFLDTNNIVQDETKDKIGLNKRQISLGEMLDYNIFDYYDHEALRDYFNGSSNNNFLTNESILNRFYYQVYLVSKYAKEITNECLYEVYFDLLNMLNIKYNIVCHYQVNSELRDTKYQALKQILAKYNLDIKDDYKHIYITALLDRKCATYNEAMLYAELEQLGDAIYNLAVCNILFYNEKTKLSDSIKENYIKADAQVKVANNLEINKLYISNLTTAINAKYLSLDDIEMGISRLNKQHYLADSLEMLLAAISKEFGVAKALDFTTKIIADTFSDLSMPIMPKFDLSSLYNSNLSRSYLNKIFPAFDDLNDSDYCEEYIVLSRELEKLISILSIGNETKEKRRYLSNFFGFYRNYNDDYDLVRFYLYYGIDKTFNEYKDSFIKHYKEHIKIK